TKAFSHGEGVAVENRFTAGMYEGIGTYVNSEYVTEEEFSTQLGDVDLQTEDKTLKGAINEVFTTGNNVKRDTVDALLSVDDSLPVTSDSNWSDVIGAIGGISTGKKWARGTVETIDIENPYGGTSFSAKNTKLVQVENLGFLPSSIILLSEVDSISQLTVYIEDFNFRANQEFLGEPDYVSFTTTTDESTGFAFMDSKVFVKDGGFKLIIKI